MTGVQTCALPILPQTSSAIFKKSIFDEIRGYDESQSYAEDGNYFMKIAAKYNVYYDPEQVVVYGAGKAEYGESGLSSNVKAMHLGILKNISEMSRLGYISFFYMLFSMIFECIKYNIRLIKLKLR